MRYAHAAPHSRGGAQAARHKHSGKMLRTAVPGPGKKNKNLCFMLCEAVTMQTATMQPSMHSIAGVAGSLTGLDIVRYDHMNVHHPVREHRKFALNLQRQ